MSVASRNAFALLDDDPSRPASPPPASAPAPQQASAPSARGSQRGRGGNRGGRYYPRGGARSNADRDPATTEEPPVGAEGTKRRFDGERKEGRGRGRGSNRGRGRTFDRHSATGKTDSEKKIHNTWGGDDGNAELKAEEAATNDAAVESGTNLNDWGAPAENANGGWGAPAENTNADWGAPAADATPGQAPDAEKPEGARRRDREPEEEDNTLTFDQYLAQKGGDESLVPKLEVRKANEGADDTLWDGAVRLEKGDGEAYFSGKVKSAPKARTDKKEKVFIEIDARFERPSRGGRGRGDRGDGRGRGDRGEGRGRGGRGRGGRGRGAANGTATVTVNVDDETAFPSLS